MATKVYEIESTVTINFNYEVDAKDKNDAVQQARLKHKQFIESLKKDDDIASTESSIDRYEESEGH